MNYRSRYCGTWYPDQPAKLRGLLESRFAESEVRTGAFLYPNAKGFVVPHAGLVYSGTVSAAVWRHMAGQGVKCVILLGFSHRGEVDGLCIPDLAAYWTPIGEVKLARELCAEAPFRRLPVERLIDHSVEIQLPFIRHALPEARLLPIYIGRCDSAELAEAAHRLAELASEDTVLVASTDFTHYGRDFGYIPFPANDQVSANLRKLDGELIEAAGSLDTHLFRQQIRETRSNLCGQAPVALLQSALAQLPGEEIYQQTLDYQTSGEITGDYGVSVGYAALGYLPSSSFRLQESDRLKLVQCAREALRGYETGGRRVPQAISLGGGTEQRAPAFVSLYEGGSLRGCIGHLRENEPLWKSVPELALSAALDDTRFEPRPVRESDLEIEISVLTPFKRVAGPERICPGRHGVMLEAGEKRGLLLPQVASDRKWNRKQFLEALSVKAGGGPDLYLHPEARLSVFEAQRFPARPSTK
jgi:AmmeMemoRadiSam system protein B/AmmeMemoRadiSam system protein A